MKTVIVSLLVSAAALSSIGQAAAAPVTYTYKGTVSWGADQGGYFGSAGANLAGQSFEFVETFDSAKAAQSSSSPYFSASSGGSDYASAKLRIGSGAFLAIDGGITANYSSNGGHSSWQYLGSSQWVGSVFSAEYASVNFQAYAPSLTAWDAPTEITFKTPVYGGSFSTYQYSFDTRNWNVQNRSAYASFNLDSLSVSAISAVPLPASAPMFGAALLGLGAVGFGAKRRRRTATAV